MKKIFTVGYEKIKTEDFIHLLKENNINVLVDVRENPFSMRKDFIKKYLSEILMENGISYTHLKMLGNPKFIRDNFKENKDTQEMLYKYMQYIRTKDLTSIAKLIGDNNICLMCYEKDPLDCHRTVLAFELYRRGIIDAFEDLRGRLPKDEILLFCQNISSVESILFGNDMHSWNIGTTDGKERISPCLSSSI